MRIILTILFLFSIAQAIGQTCYDTAYTKFVYTEHLIESGNNTVCQRQPFYISTQNLGARYCSNLNLRNGRDTLWPTQDSTYYIYNIRKTGNIISNPAFSQGLAGFSTDYQVGNYNLYNEGYLNVVSDPRTVHPSFSPCADHSGGAVRTMLVANGSTAPGKRVWYQVVNVLPNTYYDLSLWFTNVGNAQNTSLQFSVDGLLIDTAQATGTPCTWKRLQARWYSGSKTTATIAVVNLRTAAGDNDFAIDDISMTGTRYEYDFVNVAVYNTRTVSDTIRGCNIPGYPASGIYRDTLRSANGCDTLIRIRVVETTTLFPVTRLCYYSGCNSFTYNGTTYTADTVVMDTLRSVYGCDSIYLKNIITIGNIVAITQTDSVRTCAAFIWLDEKMYVNSGLYVLDTVRSAGGCDSIIRNRYVELSMPTKIISNVLFSCEPINYQGNTYTTYAVLRDTLRNALGCDSLVSVVEIVPGTLPRRRTDTLHTCIATTNKSDTLRNSIGCDSLVIERVFITPPVQRVSVHQTICAGASFQGRNNTGTYRDTLRYAGGCDSVITTLYLTVKQVIRMTTSTGICPGGTVAVAGITYTAPGVYRDTVRYANGCDSLIMHITVTGTNARLTIKKSNDINCNKGFAELQVSGAPNVTWETPRQARGDRERLSSQGNRISVTPDRTTTYYATARVGNCTVTDSITVKVNRNSTTGTMNMPNAFTPNGDGLNDCIGVRSLGDVKDLKFSIYNRWGELVYYTTNPNDCWPGTYRNQQQPAGAFVYVVSGVTACGRLDEKGTLILIR